MLDITIPSAELWDEKNERFIYTKEQTLRLEHSLVSLSKWESKWNKVFLSKKEKTLEETIDYIRCMTITQNVSKDVYNYLTNDNFSKIDEYINAPMTATYFSGKESAGRPSREEVTAETIYYWMIGLGIPPEYQKWHLNKLLALIRVCDMKNKPPKKRSKRELMQHHAAVNAANKRRFNSKG